MFTEENFENNNFLNYYSTGVEKFSAHSHITGLGLHREAGAQAKATNLSVSPVGDGLVGQVKARKAAAIITRLVKMGKIAGRCILLQGKSGTGKTAIAVGLAKELGLETPFVSICASELFSNQISKSESLLQTMRRCTGVRIAEETEVIEGEVVEIMIDRSYETMGVKTGKLTLKTTDMDSIYDLGHKMVDVILKENIQAGDVIQIVKSTGRVTKLGRSYSRSQDFDAVNADMRFVNCPDGELLKRKQVTHTVSFHDIDAINSKPQGFMTIFTGETGEINQEMREQINQRVFEWVQEEKAEFVPGVLFIDEAHLLDIECYSFLNRALENVWAPLVILASNRTVNDEGFNMPVDLLDRALIISTEEYVIDELRTILKIRCNEEEVSIEADALELLANMANETSIRYAMQLIFACSTMLAIEQTGSGITEKHLQVAYNLFCDQKRSTEHLRDHNEKYIT